MAADDPLLVEARERWNRCAEAEDAQRKAMLTAKQFQAGDQWPDEIKIQRQGGAAIQGQAAQPPRPCLTIDRLSQPVRQICNTIRAANFSIDVKPNSSGADQETADIFKGIIRRIQNQARSEGPIEWAGGDAVASGLGWFRIRTDYCTNTLDSDHPFDQDILLERITNALTVYCDPAAVKPTRSDAAYMFVTSDLDKSEFKRIYGARSDTAAVYSSLEEFAATGDTKSWVTENTIRVCEYWRMTYHTETVAELLDGRVVPKTKDLPKEQIKRERNIDRPEVKCSTICAVKELESYDWAGSHIPLIPILGEELNVDGRILLRGIIQEAMDAQRMVNYEYSAMVEASALAPKAPFIIAEGQLEGYESIWQNLNRFNYSYAPYKPTSLLGAAVPPPMRDQAEPPIQAMALLLQKSEDAIKATTGYWDPSLGQSSGSQESGRKVMALQQQAEHGSSNFLDNVARALVYAGDQLVELIPKIYDRPQRVIQILDDEEITQAVMVNHPFQVQNGQPQPVDPAVHQAQEGLAKFYDLKAGKYGVTVSVGKSYTTKRMEGAAQLGELIGHLPPEMAAVATPEYVEELDFPGAQRIASLLRRALPPQLQPPPEGEEPTIEQLQAQMAQMQSAGQLMQQELQKAQQIIQAKQVESQAKLQEAQLDNASREKIATIQALASMSATQAKIDAEDARTYIDAMENRLGKQLELHMARLGQVHEALQAEHDRAHDTGLGLMNNLHDQQMAQLGHQQALEQGQQAADLAPEPADAGAGA